MWDQGQRVLEITELLNLIVHELDGKEQCKLMLVSKYFFYSVGPMIWKKVPRLDFVLRLIKDTKVRSENPGNSEGAYHEFTRITIMLPSNPDLSRYYIYAPWVQELEIFGGCSQEIYYAHPFLTLLCGRAPLPNLRKLTTHTGADNMRSKLLMDLINIFVCPSLIEIRTIFHKKGRSTYIYPSSVLDFLKKVQDTCPQIQVLELYSGTRFHYNSPEPFPFSHQCCEVLKSFSYLRSFTSTTRILESETFEILGNLPQLELLGIRGSRMDYPVLDERLSISSNWFKQLIDLRLYDLHPQDIKVLWAQPPLVKKLGSTLIQTDPTISPKPFDESLDGNVWIDSFLTALPSLTPDLHDLTFNVGDENGTSFQISEGVKNNLHSLKLKTLKIKLNNTYNIDEGPECDGYDGGEYHG
ncbi:hypothetical protein OPQ81_006015 [Rhizoctonia solani]|nr:hypothetical protein OPQ81_006015 [Rhizoctonia solani]